MPKFKLVIFDLDGTLLDTLTDLANAANLTLSQFDFPSHSVSAYRYFIGNGVYTLIERALPADQRSSDMVKQVTDRFKINYFQNQTQNTKVYEGIAETLTFLSERGIKMAVASNKFHQACGEVVDHYFKKNTFDIVLGQRDGIPPKPHPQIVNDILKYTNCKAEECLFLGDSGVDMETAVAAHTIALGAAWGNRPKEELLDSGAQHILEHPLEITQFFS